MRLQTTTVTGCASSGCQCVATTRSAPSVAVNGYGLPELDRRADPGLLDSLVVDELLRQRAVVAGVLPDGQNFLAPALDGNARQAIAAMLDRIIAVPVVTDEACEALYEANRKRFTRGQALHVRHILFAVTPEVNVHTLLVQAEGALLELSRPGVRPDRFAELAARFSACSTRATGGDMGWIGPDDCEPELANELFEQSHSRWGMGVHPRLIHTGRGFHIVEVLGRRKGRLLAFAQARASIVLELTRQHRARSLEHYFRTLLAQARLEGVDAEQIKLEAPLRRWCHDG